jgi:hypothetical protein
MREGSFIIHPEIKVAFSLQNIHVFGIVFRRNKGYLSDHH